MIKLSKPNISEDAISAMNEVVRSGQLVHGEECNLFESELCQYLGVKHAYVVSNGTAALHLALLALEIGSGDAVIVPDFTYPATANVVEISGARVVPIDVDPNNYCIDLDKLESTLKGWEGPEKLTAIMPVHEFGYPTDMTRLNRLANKYNLSVVEDAACAIGAFQGDTKMGTAGTIGCFSFHPRKTLTTGEGGVVVTNDDGLAKRLRLFRSHGMERSEAGMKFHFPGLNYRLTNFQAALGRHQLKELSQWLVLRKKLANSYLEHLRPLSDAGKLRLPEVQEGHSWQTFMVVLDGKYCRDHVVANLRARGIETSLGAQSLSNLGIYELGDTPPNYPVGSELYSMGLALPFCELYDEEVVEKVVTALSAELI